MESKRRPGISHADNRDNESGHDFVHKSDNSGPPGANQISSTNWGQVTPTERRTEASEQVMSQRRLAPLKSTRRHDAPIANPFANIANPFASPNQQPTNSMNISQNSQSNNSSSSLFPQPSLGNTSTLTSQPSGNTTSMFQFGSTQPTNGPHSQTTQNAPFVFGQQTAAPQTIFSFGNQNPPAVSSSPSPMFSFGQQSNNPSSTTLSSSSFGNQQPAQPSFSFGSQPQSQQQDPQQTFSFGQRQSPQPTFTFGQPQDHEQTSEPSAKEQSALQNTFTFGQTQQSTANTNVGQNQTSFSSTPQSQGSLGTSAQQSYPTSNIFGQPRSDSQQPTLGGSKPSLFASQSGSNNSTLFGSSQQPTDSQVTSPFQSQNIRQDKSEASLKTTFEKTDSAMPISPTKTSGYANDNDTVMNSPPKATESKKFFFGASSQGATPSALSTTPTSLGTASASTPQSTISGLQPPKFAALNYEGGPFRNPFSSANTSSDADHTKPPQFPTFTPLASNAEAKSISITKNATSPTPNAHALVTEEDQHNSNEASLNSTQHESNASSVKNLARSYGLEPPEPLYGIEREFWDCTVQFVLLNAGFRNAIAKHDLTKDLTPLMRVYAQRARKLTKEMLSLQDSWLEEISDHDKNGKRKRSAEDTAHEKEEKRKRFDSETAPRENGKPEAEPVKETTETPGKSKTSNLFASILGNHSSPSNPSSPGQSLFGKSSSEAVSNTSKPVDSTGDDVDSAKPSDPFKFLNSAEEGGSGRISRSIFDSVGKSGADEAATPSFDKQAQVQPASSSSTQAPNTPNNKAATSLFDRITPSDNASNPFENPFANLNQEKPGDQTWKTDSPIKFGSSPQTSSLLFPSTNHASPGTSRATTPGTADGGVTSEAESTQSNAGDASEEAETPQAQIDLTAEDPKQQILFDTEKVRASIRNTSTNSWETRGVGPLRILKHEDTNAVSVLMRLSPSGKVLFHSALLKDLQYKASGNGAVVPVASEGGKLNTWYIKFKARDLAETFVDKCEELKST